MSQSPKLVEKLHMQTILSRWKEAGRVRNASNSRLRLNHNNPTYAQLTQSRFSSPDPPKLRTITNPLKLRKNKFGKISIVVGENWLLLKKSIAAGEITIEIVPTAATTPAAAPAATMSLQLKLNLSNFFIFAIISGHLLTSLRIFQLRWNIFPTAISTAQLNISNSTHASN